MMDILIQHEVILQYVRDTYKASDIKLDMEVKEDRMILQYKGNVTTLNDEVVTYEKEVVLEYVLDAEINEIE